MSTEDQPTTDTTTTVPVLLDNGAEVHEFHLLHPGGSGYRPHGIALCHYQHGIGDWVTWRIYLGSDDKWHCESGNYAVDLFEAIADFKERVGSLS